METPGTPPQSPAPPPSAPAESEPQAQGAVRGRRTLAGFALLLALAALGLSGYLGYLFYTKRALLQADVLGAIERLGQENRALEERRAALEQALADAQNRVKVLGEVQDTLRAGLDRVVGELGRGRVEWRLAEAEQLLLIANYRLQLARDTETTIAALRAADRQLQELGDPGLLPVRKLIAEEITALQSLERPDLPGLALQLGTLAQALPQLPLMIERRFETASAPSDSSNALVGDGPGWNVLREMWHDILGLVRLRSDTEYEKPLLAPEQRYFLRQNLRLMLYGAQLASLQGDVATYAQSLQAAQDWLTEYFDGEAPGVVSAHSELERLRERKLLVELPDISPSLKALRATARSAAPTK